MNLQNNKPFICLQKLTKAKQKPSVSVTIWAAKWQTSTWLN